MSYRIDLDEKKQEIIQNVGDAWKVSGRSDILPIPSRMVEAVPRSPEERVQPEKPITSELVSIAKSTLPTGSAQPAKFGEIMTVPQSNLPKGSAVPKFDLLGLKWWEYALLGIGGIGAGIIGARWGMTIAAKTVAKTAIVENVPIVGETVSDIAKKTIKTAVGK